MIKTILVPTDGSGHAQMAVELGADLAAKYAARLVLLHVGFRGGDVPQELKERAEREFEQARRTGKLASEHRGWPRHQQVLAFLNRMILRDAQRIAEARGAERIEPVLEFGNVGIRILLSAWHAGADLIVMGKPGHGELQELFLGSNWQRVHDRTLCTCVTVRRPEDRAWFEGIRTVLVATDGAAHGTKAVALASEMAAKYGARIVLLHILLRGAAPERLRALVDVGQLSEATRKRLGQPGGAAHVSDSGLEDVADRILQTATSVAKEKGVAEVEVRKAEGDPARQILDTAKRERADVIAVSDELGEIQGIPLGDVSHKIARLAECTTITVR